MWLMALLPACLVSPEIRLELASVQPMALRHGLQLGVEAVPFSKAACAFAT